MADLIRVKNTSDKDWEGKYNSKPYVIPAGGEALVDAEAAAKDFGDWTLRNGPPRYERRKEYQRLRGLYGALDGMPGADERFAEHMPHVELYTREGIRITGVLDDPEGTSLSAVGAGELRQQEIIEDLRRRLETLEGGSDTPTEATATGEVLTDSPSNAPSRARRRPSVIPSREE